MKYQFVLAIETSCDDTSVAIVRQDGWVEAICSANQDLAHQPFGGVVPEIASRNHTLNMLPLIEECFKKAQFTWKKIDGIVVTSRPGLIGALIVGVVTAKSLSYAMNKPFLGVNHLEGHLLAPFLKDKDFAPPLDFTYPYIGLAVSGGHTQLYNVKGLGHYEILGKTVDDAAGEAFDKFAKVLGLGFPGGVLVDKLSQSGDSSSYDFPRSMIREDHFNFSFSGLKASGQRQIMSMSEQERRDKASDLCASYQQAIVDVLISKLEKAVERFKSKSAIITGGVSANSCLRKEAQVWAQKKGVELVIPPIRYCTDNAAMIGYVGIQRLNRGEVSPMNLAPTPRVYAGDFLEFNEAGTQ